MIWVWIVLVFVLGAAIGSFLNVCADRLPLEKSILWPGSRCGSCLRPIAWYDNIPIVSYFILRGRCRACAASFSFQYPLLELFTALAFAGLFYVEIVLNVGQYAVLQRHQADIDFGVIPWQGWAIFGHRALLLSFLLGAAACDLKCREIPLGLTVTGTAVGLAFAVFFPWPWPYSVAEAERLLPVAQAWQIPVGPGLGPVTGLVPWPVWGPLPDWLAPGGNWQTGLATAVVGALVGTFLLRGIRWIFHVGLGVEAIGLGDADILMMAGAFLGWQAAIGAFFLGIFPALFIGLVELIRTGDNAVAFGPGLAIGVVVAWMAWPTIVGPAVQFVAFTPPLLVILGVMCALFLGAAALLLRWMGRGRPRSAE